MLVGHVDRGAVLRLALPTAGSVCVCGRHEVRVGSTGLEGTGKKTGGDGNATHFECRPE